MGFQGLRPAKRRVMTKGGGARSRAFALARILIVDKDRNQVDRSVRNKIKTLIKTLKGETAMI